MSDSDVSSITLIVLYICNTAIMFRILIWINETILYDRYNYVMAGKDALYYVRLKNSGTCRYFYP